MTSGDRNADHRAATAVRARGYSLPAARTAAPSITTAPPDAPGTLDARPRRAALRRGRGLRGRASARPRSLSWAGYPLDRFLAYVERAVARARRVVHGRTGPLTTEAWDSMRT